MSVSTVFGVGINDSTYPTEKRKRVNGVHKLLWVCPYYRKWVDMLKRCYSKRFHEKNPTYIEVEVCERWKTFSLFKEWVDEQPVLDWKDKSLDKDFLSDLSKLYSPFTCVFIDRRTNCFILDNERFRGKHPTGVSFMESRDKFQAYCNNPWKGKRETLGYFVTDTEAHEAWRKKKHQHSMKLASEQSDPRITSILMVKYSKECWYELL